MNCPHCQSEVPEKLGDQPCPACGRIFSAPLNDSPKTSPRRFGWLAFGLILAIPAIANWIVPFGTFIGLDGLGVMIMVSVIGSAASGVGAGILVARWKGGSLWNQISTGIVFSVLLTVVSFAICCASCAVPSLIGGMVR